MEYIGPLIYYLNFLLYQKIYSIILVVQLEHYLQDPDLYRWEPSKPEVIIDDRFLEDEDRYKVKQVLAKRLVGGIRNSYTEYLIQQKRYGPKNNYQVSKKHAIEAEEAIEEFKKSNYSLLVIKNCQKRKKDQPVRWLLLLLFCLLYIGYLLSTTLSSSILTTSYLYLTILNYYILSLFLYFYSLQLFIAVAVTYISSNPNIYNNWNCLLPNPLFTPLQRRSYDP